MGIKAGLVGLPNVGKSTLFNALTRSSVPAANYPFCTIDPHVAITNVPDTRLEQLQKIYKSGSIIPSNVTFVDIAGLVKGAAQGEGLGNQFLSHIREVDLILHVLRCFEDPDIIHQSENIDPINDYEVILAELMLKDFESVTKRLEKMPKLIKVAQGAEKKELEAELQLLTSLEKILNEGSIKEAQALLVQTDVKTVPLLSTKNFLIIANIAEHELENKAYHNNKYYQALVNKFGNDKVIPVCAKVEHELSQLSDTEAQEFMTMLGIEQGSLATIIRQSYENLGLITFFTCGPKEIHAWPIKKGLTVKQAAGEIHSDLERGFICAEVFNSEDLFKLGTIAAVKDQGKVRTEGADYIVRDGDIILVRFNV